MREHMNLVESGPKVFRVYFTPHAYYEEIMGEDPWDLPEEITVGHTMKPHKVDKMIRWAVKRRLEIDKRVFDFIDGEMDDPEWEQNTIDNLKYHIHVETMRMDEYSDSVHFNSDNY